MIWIGGRVKKVFPKLVEVSVPLRGNDLNRHCKSFFLQMFQQVSVPLRGNDLNPSHWCAKSYLFTLCFRPLAGKWFESWRSIQMRITRKVVSVPLRGNDLNPNQETTVTGNNNGFPSPCGEMIWISWSERSSSQAWCRLSFPSPCGEMIWIKQRYEIRRKEILVSVPLRGNDLNLLKLTFTCRLRTVSVPLRGNDLNLLLFVQLVSTSTHCFRPLAGKWFESLGISLIPGFIEAGFPSPCGEMIWINFCFFNQYFYSRS